jgi:hypothetical protein
VILGRLMRDERGVTTVEVLVFLCVLVAGLAVALPVLREGEATKAEAAKQMILTGEGSGSSPAPGSAAAPAEPGVPPGIGGEWGRQVYASYLLQKFFDEIRDGAIKGDFDDDPTFVSIVTQVIVGGIPYAGQAADLRDLSAASRNFFESANALRPWGTPETRGDVVYAVIGVVPWLGDGAKAKRRWDRLQRAAGATDDAQSIWDAIDAEGRRRTHPEPRPAPPPPPAPRP